MKGYRDPYKVEQINKILGATDFYAYLSGDKKTSGAKTINLDGEILELAKAYYEGKKITVGAEEADSNKEIIFNNAAEMLAYLRDSGDLYNPLTRQYVFGYNEEGSIAVYSNMSKERAMGLSKDMKDTGETGWQAFLGAGGDIYDVGDDSAQYWCEKNFDQRGWVRADEDTFAESEDAQWAVTSYWCGESGETKIWLCSSEKEAIEKMQRLWEKSYNFALEDDNFDEERSYHEEHEARVAWDDELYRVFEVVEVSALDDEEI